jgi:hypothetical protein
LKEVSKIASKGFEFVGMLDGSNATPVIRDFILSTAAAHKTGDLMVVASDGDLTQATTSTTEVTAVCMETIAAADITAGTTTAKCAIITHNQIWRCSMNSATCTIVIGYAKTVDTIDANTLDPSGTSGAGILLSRDMTDDDGYVLAEIVFSDTTFGNV